MLYRDQLSTDRNNGKLRTTAMERRGSLVGLWRGRGNPRTIRRTEGGPWKWSHQWRLWGRSRHHRLWKGSHRWRAVLCSLESESLFWMAWLLCFVVAMKIQGQRRKQNEHTHLMIECTNSWVDRTHSRVEYIRTRARLRRITRLRTHLPDSPCTS